jgi:hypothetical protein
MAAAAAAKITPAFSNPGAGFNVLGSAGSTTRWVHPFMPAFVFNFNAT